MRLAVLLVVFAVGLAFGETLDDSTPPTGTDTTLRTLKVPETLSGETVTVTVTTAP